VEGISDEKEELGLCRWGFCADHPESTIGISNGCCARLEGELTVCRGRKLVSGDPIF
jgi:hypothetical protein